MEHMNMLPFLLVSEFMLDSLWAYSSHIFSYPHYLLMLMPHLTRKEIIIIPVGFGFFSA